MSEAAEIRNVETRGLRHLLGVIGGTVHALSFAVWLGGLITIGALLGPTVASALAGPHPGLDPNALKQFLTAGIIGAALHHFNIVCYVAGILMIVSDVFEGLAVLSAAYKMITFVRTAATVLLLITAFYLGLKLMPEMDNLIHVGQGGSTLFDDLHKQYENISSFAQLPLLLVIAGLTAWRNHVTHPKA